MQILADGKMHSPIELYRINGLREDISQTIQLMVCENQVEVIDGMLSMRKTKKKNEGKRENHFTNQQKTC